MNDAETQREYLHRQLRERLLGIRSSMTWYRRRYYASQMSTVTLAAIITVLAGFRSKLPSTATANAILALGAVSTVISAWGAFFAPQKSWLLVSEIYAKLRSLQAKLEFVERNPGFVEREESAISGIFEEYQKVLEDYNQRWQQVRQKGE